MNRWFRLASTVVAMATIANLQYWTLFVKPLIGARNASANYGFRYSTKGVAAIVGGGLAAMLFEKTGSWNAVFYGGAIMAFFSALMAAGVSKMPSPRKSQRDSLVAAEVQEQTARG